MKKKLLAYFIIFLCTMFFIKEIKTTFLEMNDFSFTIHWGYLFSSLALMCIAYIFLTPPWFIGIHAFDKNIKVGIINSFSILNTTRLSKYLPGKIWSYAIQMTLLQKKGISKAYVVFFNLIYDISGILGFSTVGCLFLLSYPSFMPTHLIIFSLITFCLIYCCLIFKTQLFFNSISYLINKILKKEIQPITFSPQILLKIQPYYFLSALSFGLSGYFLMLGLGLPATFQQSIFMMASFLIADIIGYVVLIVPGGFGVREGTLFLMLGTIFPHTTALLLPLGLRAITMTTDCLLSLISLCLLRPYLKEVDLLTPVPSSSLKTESINQ